MFEPIPIVAVGGVSRLTADRDRCAMSNRANNSAPNAEHNLVPNSENNSLHHDTTHPTTFSTKCVRAYLTRANAFSDSGLGRIPRNCEIQQKLDFVWFRVG